MSTRGPRPQPLSLRRVVRDVGSGDGDEGAARARLAALAGIEHPGLVVPLDVRRDGPAVQVCAPRIPAPDLGSVRGEGIDDLAAWVWLVGGVAEALAALHAAGLAHGDVSPGNVLVGERPMLVDLIGPAMGREHGTPGFRAPEHRDGPGAAGDVFALGALARYAAAPSLAPEVRAWTAPLLAEDPTARPTAAAVAAGITRCAAPVRWRAPEPSTAEAARAVSSTAITERDPAAWGWRLRRRAVPIVACLVLAGAAGFLWSALPSEPVPLVAVPVGVAGPPTPAPDAAARELTETRFAALRAGDGEALAELAVPGSAAWAQVEQQARMLEGGARLADLPEPRVEAVVLAQGDGTASVAVTTRIGAYRVVDANGATVDLGPSTERAVLELAWSGQRWRVSDVSAAP